LTDIVKIDNHTERALDRSATQYRQKPKHEAFISSFADQVQDAEDAVFDMIDARVLENAEGAQLDGIGEIVGLDRQGRGDDEYRILLLVKIGQNSSQGGPEKVIQIFRILIQAGLVHYQNLEKAAIMLGSDTEIPEDDVEFVYRNMELIAAGGVRIDHIVCFDADAPFAFEGNNPLLPGAGWSDITGTQGGKFAKLQRNKTPFAFDGIDVDVGGWGSLVDPIAGGTFVGIGG